MAEYDETGKSLTLKIVYYGPAQSGKTTNLSCLHELVMPEKKGALMTMETKSDRTLFFDLLPLGFRAKSGILIKLRLFTVPGQVAHDSTRKAVLSRADAVVFVADSQRTQVINNGESFQNLADNAARVGLDIERLPLVVQFNKRDLPKVLGEEEIRERWQGARWPIVLSSALRGEGVRETFSRVLADLFRQCDAEFELSSAHGVSAADFVTGLTAFEGVPAQ